MATEDMMEVSETLLPGIRVVECAAYAAGPTIGAVLADLGADVVHVEEPSRGDPYRYLVTQATIADDRDAYFNPVWELVNHNKRSATISLKTPEGYAAFCKMIAGADVFITNMLPSRRAQLKVRYEDLQPLNERLIYASVTGYGENGPLRDKPGYDASAYWAGSSLMGMYAELCGEPPLCRGGMGDRAAGLVAAGAVGLALYNRERTGKGQQVSVSLLHVGMWQAGMDIQRAEVIGEPMPLESRQNGSNPLWNTYRTSDNRWIFLALFPEWKWDSVCRAMDMEHLADDPRFQNSKLRRQHLPETMAVLGEAMAKRTMAEWEKRLTEYEIIFSPVLMPKEVADSEQVAANGMFFDAVHSNPEIGEFRLLRNPMNFSRTPPRFRSPGPGFGTDTLDVLREAGCSNDEIHGVLAAQGSAPVQQEIAK